MRLCLALSLCLAILALGMGAAVAASPGTWSPTGSMTTPRSDQLAASLANGNVLVVGGTGHGRSAEVYDTATGTWAKTGDAPFAPTQLVGLRNAGANSSVLGLAGTSAALYSPASGRWTTIKGPTSQGVAVLLANGLVLVVGDPSVIYDPVSGASTPTRPRVVQGRSGFRATLLQDGRVLVSGGDAPDSFGSEPLPAELFDPGTGTWRSTGTTIDGRRNHLAVLLPNGDVLIAGGTRFGGGGLSATVDTAERYDPRTEKWTSAGSTGSSPDSLTRLADGRVLAAGGLSFERSTFGTVCRVSAESFLYDAATNRWTPTGRMREASGRPGHSATLLSNGMVLAAGGTHTRVVATPEGGSECVSTPSDVLASAELFTPPAAGDASLGRSIPQQVRKHVLAQQQVLQTVQARIAALQPGAVRAEATRALGGVGKTQPGG